METGALAAVAAWIVDVVATWWFCEGKGVAELRLRLEAVVCSDSVGTGSRKQAQHRVDTSYFT